MIQLNVDLSFLSKYFELTTSRINGYASKSIDQVMKEEEQSGNTAAAQWKTILQQPEKVAQLFMLQDATNRFLIIKNLSDEDLKQLLPYLNKKDLIWGLKFFTKDKLMDLMTLLPKKDLLSVVSQNFTLEDILKFMPTEELNKFLENDKIEKPDIMKHFKQLEYKDLQRIFSEYIGEDVFKEETDENKQVILSTIENLPPQEFKKFLFGMQNEDKCAMIMGLVENKPELMLEFENKSIVRPMELLEKPEILKTLNVLNEELLVKMVDNLPSDLIQVIATQIDPQVFAEILIDKFPDVLKNIAL